VVEHGNSLVVSINQEGRNREEAYEVSETTSKAKMYGDRKVRFEN
jgi:hypothetical protein